MPMFAAALAFLHGFVRSAVLLCAAFGSATWASSMTMANFVHSVSPRLRINAASVQSSRKGVSFP
jgi:hypothetical protein